MSERTYVAVAKYRLAADDAEKRRDLTDGLSMVVTELVYLGVPPDEIEQHVQWTLDEAAAELDPDR